jgi:hypothetical protein
MYYTPTGKYAIVVADREKRLDFYENARSVKLTDGLPVPCRGVNDIDFAADGTHPFASCDFRVTGEGGRRHTPGGRNVEAAAGGSGTRLAPGRADLSWRRAHARRTRPPWERTACTRAGIRKCCTARTAMKGLCRSSTLRRGEWSRSGRSRTAAARTWGAFQPAAECCGCHDGTTGRFTHSTPRTCVYPQPGRYSLRHTGVSRYVAR